MNRIARIASVAAASLALVSAAAPLVSAAPAPAPADGARQSAAVFKVAAQIDKLQVVAGEDDAVRITGRVRPTAAGQKVVLQQRLGNATRWTKSGTAKIKSSGRFVLTDEPSRAGVRFYRVMKPAAGGIKAGMSKELQLDVWGWEPLVLRSAGANSGVLIYYTAAFSTVPYSYSLVLKTAGTAGYVEYTLGKKCRSLRASYALTDSSPSGSTGSVTVSVDGVGVVTHPLATGTLEANHVIDVTNAFRVRFDLSATATPAGYAAVGNPEVLCLP
jgi:hypothetical protein